MPWNIRKEREMEDILIYHEFGLMVDEFNELAKFKNYEIWILRVFKMIYFPIYYIIEKKIKK